jgi:hypothetical protein
MSQESSEDYLDKDNNKIFKKPVNNYNLFIINILYTISLLKSKPNQKSNIKTQDLIWKKICTDLNYEF